MGYIIENEIVYLIGKGSVDSWGIGTLEGTRTPIKCLVKSSEVSTGIATVGGKQIIPNYDIYINGKSAVRVGDRIEVDGDIKEVLAKREGKDLSRQVVYTKLTV